MINMFPCKHLDTVANGVRLATCWLANTISFNKFDDLVNVMVDLGYQCQHANY